MSEGKARRVPFSVDSAEYIGDGQDGVYIQAARWRGQWYVTTVVDSETGHFVQDMVTDDGPYATEQAAYEAGRDAAREWCIENDVSYDAAVCDECRSNGPRATCDCRREG